MLRVPLNPGLDGCRTAFLRELTGADELAASAGSLALLDRLLIEHGPGALPAGRAAHLPVGDRDRVLAALHQLLFGDRIEADTSCAACGEPFELTFSLAALIAGQSLTRPDEVEGPDEQGRYRLGNLLFRLPASADIAAAAVVAANRQREALLTACLIEGSPAGREDAIEEAMAALGPPLDCDIDASCPHCGGTTPARFDVGTYLLKCLANERRFVLREVHRIARAYGWSLGEILALPRSHRQDFVRLIDSEAEPARRPLSLVR